MIVLVKLAWVPKYFIMVAGYRKKTWHGTKIQHICWCQGLCPNQWPWKEWEHSRATCEVSIEWVMESKDAFCEVGLLGFTVHHGGSYDVQQHVISLRHQRNARWAIRAETDRSLKWSPMVQDTEQVHLWCAVRLSFPFTYCRSKHWHEGWKIAGSVISAGFFDHRLQLFFNLFLHYASVHFWDLESLYLTAHWTPFK